MIANGSSFVFGKNNNSGWKFIENSLSGDNPESAFNLVGNIEQAIEKGERLMREAKA